VQTLVGAPVDLLKIRLQLQEAMPGRRGYVGPLPLLRSVLRAEGAAGLWRGTAVTAVRDVPSYGLYFVAYDLCCVRVRAMLEGGAGPGAAACAWCAPAAQFLSGGLAGVLAWGSIYPVDVFKSRIQATSAAGSPYRGWVHCAVQSCRQEGPGVLTRGLGATLARAFVVNAAIFATYEACMGLGRRGAGGEGAGGGGGDGAQEAAPG
jgi:solute carrier family 25 carnitine/acylcarnitine transporter 20/29